MIQLVINIISHPAFNIICLFLGFLIGEYFARRKYFNEIFDKFGSEFSSIIIKLRANLRVPDNHVIKPAEIITDSILITQEKAKIAIEFLLSKRDRHRFDEAWEDYKFCKENYTNNPGTKASDREISKYYLDVIDKLLSFRK